MIASPDLRYVIASPHLRYVRRRTNLTKDEQGLPMRVGEELVLQQRLIEHFMGDNGEVTHAYVWKDVPVVDEAEASGDMVV